VRPPILFTAMYGAGLATGLLHFGGLLGAVAMVLVAIVLARRGLITLFASTFLIGRVSGEVARLGERDTCAARLPAGLVRLRVRLLEPADSGGGRLEVQPLEAQCRGPVLARWPTAHPAGAGSLTQVTARWIPSPGTANRAAGTLVVASIGRFSGRAAFPDRLRGALAQASRVLYGARAAMVDALVLGRRSEMDRSLQDRFAQSGLVHLLSISGFHVGVITTWVFLIARLLGFGRAPALGLGAAVSVLYSSTLPMLGVYTPW